MAILKENEFISVSYLADTQLLWATWKAKSEWMSEENFKSVNLFYVECFEQSPVSAFLIDSREFSFSINPELQAWVATHIISRAIALGLKKLAFMVSKEFIAQLSIEQTIEESGDTPFQTQYFDELEKAKNWCEA